MNTEQLRQYIVHPILKELGHGGKEAENLVLGTAAVESQMGEYIHQIGGPALGIYQMEPATHKDIWDNYLNFKLPLSHKILDICNFIEKPDPEELTSNLKYATIMCRVHYLRVKERLPGTVSGYAKYWKKYYNTLNGKGTIDKFIVNYNRYVNATTKATL